MMYEQIIDNSEWLVQPLAYNDAGIQTDLVDSAPLTVFRPEKSYNGLLVLLGFLVTMAIVAGALALFYYA